MLHFCRDCENFEERRDLDYVALCKKNLGPNVCCEDFKPKDEEFFVDKPYNRICVECTNFEEVNENAICARNHFVGVACDMYRSRFEKLYVTTQNERKKTVLLLYSAIYNTPGPIQSALVQINRKMKF